MSVLVARNNSFLAHAKRREVAISTEFAAETVQVTTITGKARIAVIVIVLLVHESRGAIILSAIEQTIKYRLRLNCINGGENNCRVSNSVVIGLLFLFFAPCSAIFGTLYPYSVLFEISP